VNLSDTGRGELVFHQAAAPADGGGYKRDQHHFHEPLSLSRRDDRRARAGCVSVVAAGVLRWLIW